MPSDQPFPADGAVEQMLSARLALSSVTVAGAKRTSPKLLHRLTHPVISTGGSFSSVIDDVSRVVDLLRATHCFNGVDAFIDTDSDPNVSTLTLTLSEKSLYQLHTGTSISTSPDARPDPSLEASFICRNPTGNIDSLKAAVTWMPSPAAHPFSNNPTLRFQADYLRPFALSLNTGLFSSLSSSLHNHENNSSHSLTLRQASFGLDHPLGRLSLLTAWRHVRDLDENASPLVHLNAGHSYKTSIQHSITLDSRDLPAMPSDGSCFTLNSEATLPVGDVRFFKSDASFQHHMCVGASQLTASLVGRLGGIYSQYRTSIIDRFYLGGPTSFRGFNNRGLGPRDANDSVGGDLYYTLGAMLSLPLPESSMLSQLFNARLHVFGTVGDLTDIPTVRHIASTMLADAPVTDRARSTWKQLHESMRISAGLGLALTTAVGRVELNFCRVLRSADSDSASSGFQFGISESFC